MEKRNPFLLPGSESIQHISADDRIHAVKSFTKQQCVAAIELPIVLQKTVIKAIRRRMKELNNEQK